MQPIHLTSQHWWSLTDLDEIFVLFLLLGALKLSVLKVYLQLSETLLYFMYCTLSLTDIIWNTKSTTTFASSLLLVAYATLNRFWLLCILLLVAYATPNRFWLFCILFWNTLMIWPELLFHSNTTITWQKLIFIILSNMLLFVFCILGNL